MGKTTPVQSGPGSNGNEEVLYTPQISKIGTSPSAAALVIPKTSLFRCVLPPCRGYIQHILRLTNGWKVWSETSGIF